MDQQHKSKFGQVEPSAEAIEQAKLCPGGWVYQIEGNYDHDEYIPPEVIVGAWKVNEEGMITGDFVPNPKYVPGNS